MTSGRKKKEFLFWQVKKNEKDSKERKRTKDILKKSVSKQKGE